MYKAEICYSLVIYDADSIMVVTFEQTDKSIKFYDANILKTMKLSIPW